MEHRAEPRVFWSPLNLTSGDLPPFSIHSPGPSSIPAVGQPPSGCGGPYGGGGGGVQRCTIWHSVVSQSDPIGRVQTGVHEILQAMPSALSIREKVAHHCVE